MTPLRLDPARPGQPGVFVGREPELERVRALLCAPTGGTGVMVRGGPGAGKSALLDHVAGTATGRVLRAGGVRSEDALPLAAVADLLAPLLEFLGELPPAQREGMEVGLALRPGPGSPPLATCAATLGVLTAAARRTSVLVVVDDFQWVDPLSRQALLFAARRLPAGRAGMLIAMLDGPGSPEPPVDLPTVRLEGLTVEDCAQLVRAAGADPGLVSVRRLHERTGGNPLAVLEFLGSGVDPVDFPAGGSPASVLHRSWTDALDGLPERAAGALFVLAVSRSTAVADLVRSLAPLGLALDDLGAAERSGLVDGSRGEIRLRHPPLRAAVVERTPLAVRVAGYRALAETAPSQHRVWYRAAATGEPDARVADDLVAAAIAARRRCEYGASARTWRRAGQLTPDLPQRAARLLEGARDAVLSGEAGLALSTCDEALASPVGPALAGDVDIVRGRARMLNGAARLAVDGLLTAAGRVRTVDVDRATALLAEAATAGVIAGDVRRAAATVAAATACGSCDRRPFSALVAAAVAAAAGVGGCDVGARPPGRG